MALIAAQQRRGLTLDLTIQDADGNTITPGANDRVRVIIGRLDQLGGSADVPTGHEFLVESGSPTVPNGSSITRTSPHRLRLDAQDLTFDPGMYSLLMDLFDNADAQEWKNVSEQTFHLAER